MQVTKTIIFFVVCVQIVDVYSTTTLIFYCTPHDTIVDIVDNVYDCQQTATTGKNSLV